MLIWILAAVLGFVTIAGLGLAFVGGDQSNARALKRAHALTSVGRAEKVRRAKIANSEPGQRRKQLLKTLKEQEHRQRKATLSLTGRLQQAGLSVTVVHFWIASAAVGVVASAAALVAHGPWYVVLGLGFVAGFGLPRWVIDFLAKKRMKVFTSHFADAIDIIVRGVRSGLPVHDCLRIIARESPAPLGPEFQRLVENLGLGVSMDQALEKVFERMPTSELRFFTIVLAIQQKTGGNLAEALANLSAVLRARKMMREKIKAMSSEAIASAMIIGCLPPGVVTLIMVTNPAYMSVMFTDPRGHMFLGAGVLWMSMGIFVMRKMINFKF
jgi:tight adherence protein B